MIDAMTPLWEEEPLFPSDTRSYGARRNGPLRLERPAPCDDAKSAALRCLIVDDKDYFLHAVSALLKREGITVSGVAFTSAEALQHVDEVHPDVALVDIALGGESGFELARRLSEMTDEQPTVILTSTYAEEDIRHLIATSSADGFVPKTQLSGAVIREIHRRRLTGT